MNQILSLIFIIGVAQTAACSAGMFQEEQVESSESIQGGNNGVKASEKPSRKERRRDSETSRKDRDQGKRDKAEDENPSLTQVCDVKGETRLVGPNESFFDKKVWQAVLSNDRVLDKPCQSCHIGPRVEVAQRGPEQIRTYCHMYGLLRGGAPEPDPINNPLMLRVTGVISHAGGDYCRGGLEDPVCAAILDWYEVEFGGLDDRDQLEKPEAASTSLQTIEIRGVARGYAVSPEGGNNPVMVRLYIDGSNTSQVTPIEVVADSQEFAQITGGNFGFKVPLPATALDGRPHQLFAYFVNAQGNEVALRGSPKTFTAYSQQGNFSANVATNLVVCESCHGASEYQTMWNRLVTPLPSNGGSPTNNNLYNKATGGANHGGGNRCDAACATAIRNWWTDEFGN